MTVKELIDKLKSLPQHAEVLAWDWNSECYEKITGLIASDDGESFLIETDQGAR